MFLKLIHMRHASACHYITIEFVNRINQMQEKNNIIAICVTVMVILASFAWIGYAYIMGAKVAQMLLHPIVPLLLIVLLIRFRGDESTRFVVNILFVFIGIWLFVRLQNVFMPFIVGFSLAYVVQVLFAGLRNIPLPKGKRLQLPKWGTVVLLLFIIIGVITFITFGIVPQLVQQVSDMQDSMAGFYENVRDYTTTVSDGMANGDYPFKDRLPESWQAPVSEYLDKMVSSIKEKVPSMAESVSQMIGFILGKISAGVLGTFGKISSVFFIIIVFVYAIQSFRSHIKKALGVFPEAQRERLVLYLREIDNDMRAFLRGQISVILIISTLSAIVYSIIGVPFALLVGTLAGLFNAIPTVGPVIGGAVAVLATLMGFAAGYYDLTRLLLQILLVLGAAFGIQIIDSAFVSTRIMSKAIDVNPLIVMFAVLLAAALAGIWGAVLTIPGIIVIKGIINVQKRLKEERSAD
jgi:predicted PurR-regulated permease PerM